MPRGHRVCHEIQLTQRAACLLCRGLGVSCLFPCWLSVEVLVWLWGGCCLTVEVAVCDHHNKVGLVHRDHLGPLPWHSLELSHVCQKANDLLVPGDILCVHMGSAARTRLCSAVGMVMMTDTFATFKSTLYFTK